MKTVLIALACAAFLAACSGQSSSSGGSSNVGGGSSVGSGPIGSTSSSSMLMQQIKTQDSGGK